MKNETFDLLLSEVPYKVKAIPFLFNNETRFLISYNDGPEFIFAWDDEMKQFKAITDDSYAIPADLEQAIAARVYRIWPKSAA